MVTPPPSPLSLLLPVAIACAACAQPPSAPVDAAPRDVPSAEATVDVNAPRDAAQPDAVDEDVPCAQRPDVAGVSCVRRVRGRAVDLAGAGLAGRVVSYCGGGCFGGVTEADGTFAIDVNDFVIPEQYTLLLHGRPEHASLYVPGPMPVDGAINFPEPVAVPRYEDVGDLIPESAPAGSYTAGDVTLTIAAGSQVEFDVEDAVLGELGHRVRAAWVPMARAPGFAREAGVVALWAMAPFSLTSDRPIALRLRNRAMLAAGSAVDIVMMGLDVTELPVTGGRPLVVAAAHVSSDGTTVTTDPGEGLRALSWIGLRPHR